MTAFRNHSLANMRRARLVLGEPMGDWLGPGWVALAEAICGISSPAHARV
jgi:hypothetical protein